MSYNYNKHDTQEEGLAKALTGCVSALLYIFLSPMLIMLGMGALHSASPNVPAVGYWTTFGVLFGVGEIVGLVKRWIKS